VTFGPISIPGIIFTFSFRHFKYLITVATLGWYLFGLEEIIFVYLIGLMGLIKLYYQKAGAITWFVGIFFGTLLFVSHRDIIRYALPIVPFLILAYSKTIIKKEFRIVMMVLVIPIYLFSLAYISQNVMQISDWSPFL